MKSTLRPLIAVALGAAACPALAQNAAPVAVQSSAPAAIDAAQLALGREIAEAVFPKGTYARVMNGSMQQVIDMSINSTAQMPMRDLARLGGLSEEELGKVGPATLKDMMAILDPAFQERTQLATRVMVAEMATLMSTFEPGMRDGLAEAYARKFTRSQLADMRAFFATPSGAAYASESMTLFMDPAVTSRMQAIMPELLKKMPAIIAQVQTATANLPKPRKFSDLNKSERAKLAALLGVPENKLNKP